MALAGALARGILLALCLAAAIASEEGSCSASGGGGFSFDIAALSVKVRPLSTHLAPISSPSSPYLILIASGGGAHRGTRPIYI